MKILYCSTGCFDKGGISRYNRYQIQALRELEGEDNVRVLSLAGQKSDDFEIPFSVYWSGQGPTIVSKIRYALKLFFQVILWRPDLIVIGHVNLSGLALLISKISKSTTLLNTYGLEVWSGLRSLPSWGLKNVNFVLSDCHYTANYLEQSEFRAVSSVIVIWDCVNLARFYQDVAQQPVLTSYGIPDLKGHRLIVSLGRISKAAAHKGYDRLIKAFSLIHSEFADVRLVFAGKGDWIDYLKELAEQNGVKEKVIFTGMVNEKHLVDIYRSAYVFSLVSDRGVGRGEGIPLTPLEAMSCGVPIIVGNQDGSQEAVLNDENGFVIDPLDINLHALKLKQLLSDRNLRDRKAESSIRVAHKYFSYSEFKEKHRVMINEFVKFKGKN